VDERHDYRDTGSACVPSTVWGAASSKPAKFNVGAVLAPRYKQACTPARQRYLSPRQKDKMRERITLADALLSTQQAWAAVEIPARRIYAD
jgi:hypothetical protein